MGEEPFTLSWEEIVNAYEVYSAADEINLLTMDEDFDMLARLRKEVQPRKAGEVV